MAFLDNHTHRVNNTKQSAGAPIDITPDHDDTAIANDPKRNNDFQYEFPGDPQGQARCPFAAHVRKTNPRNDLEQQGIPVQPQRILRRGIQFGPEVSDQERNSGKTSQERGLLFLSYQSNITNGFNFIQQSKCSLSPVAWSLPTFLDHVETFEVVRKVLKVSFFHVFGSFSDNQCCFKWCFHVTFITSNAPEASKSTYITLICATRLG